MPNPDEFVVTVQPGAAITALVYPAEGYSLGAALILGHGAGADQRSSFMVTFARAFSALGLDVVTFNFLYTEQRRRVPDRQPVLESSYRAVIGSATQKLGSAREALFIGGKSMGGRIATHVAAADPHLPLKGLVLLGYPLHPPGRPTQRRDAHLPAIGRPLLFVQGSRDAFGTPQEFAGLLNTLRPPASLHVVDGGDHSFKVRKDQAAVYTTIQRAIVNWIDGVTGRGDAVR